MSKSGHYSDGDARDEPEVRRRHSRDRQSDGEEVERHHRRRGDLQDDERERGRRPHHDRELTIEDEDKERKRRRRERELGEKQRIQNPQGEEKTRSDKHSSLPSKVQSSGRTHAQGEISNTTDTKPTQFLVLHNIFDKSVERDNEFYIRLREEVHMECAVRRFVVHSIYTDRHNGHLCLQCDSIRSAVGASQRFGGKLFHGRMINCSFMDEKVYNRRFGGK